MLDSRSKGYSSRLRILYDGFVTFVLGAQDTVSTYDVGSTMFIKLVVLVRHCSTLLKIKFDSKCTYTEKNEKKIF